MDSQGKLAACTIQTDAYFDAVIVQIVQRPASLHMLRIALLALVQS